MKEKIFVFFVTFGSSVKKFFSFRSSIIKSIVILLISIFLILFTAWGVSSIFLVNKKDNFNCNNWTFSEKERFIKNALKLNRFNSLNITEYTVKKSDNFWKIARDFGVDIHTVIGCNPYLEDFLARVDQKIVVPNKKGILHQVRFGETLVSIANFYGVSQQKIIEANGGFLYFLFPLKTGRVLFIPDVLPKIVSEKIKSYYEKRKIFCSPMSGSYSSGFGWRIHPITLKRQFHTGLDIRARIGTPVFAAGPGSVIVAGELNGYGKAVVINHQNGLSTLYAHNSVILVRPGQYVKKGQIIARSGKSGTANGPHLHFEVRKNGIPQDPALYLW